MSPPNSQTATGTSTRRKRDDATRSRLADLVRSSTDAIVGETPDGVITDRTAAENALAASEALLHVAFENAPIGMLLASPELRPLKVNRALCTMLGYTADELLTLSTWAFTHPEDIAPNQTFMQRALAGEIASYTLEKRYLHRDGRIVWGHLSGSLVRDADGAPLYFISQIQDITERKASEAALRASEERFRSIFTGAGIGMALVTSDGTLQVANPALETLLGYGPGELTGVPIDAITFPDDLREQRTYRRRLAAGELENYHLEKRYIRKDGGIVWGLLNASVIRDEHGAVIGVIGQVQDITERKAAAAELAATHQRTRQVLERITDGFYALDREWRFTYINTAAERMLGSSREALLGESIWDAFPPAIQTSLYTAYHQAIAEGRTVSVEVSYPPLASWFDVRAYPSLEGVSVFFRDVTEDRRLTDELRSSEARFRTLVEQLPAFVYLLAVDEQQTPLYFSPYIEAVTGETPEEAMAFHDVDNWLDMVHPEDRERVAAEDERSGERAEPFRAEYRHRHTNGSYVWVRDECVPVHDDGGTIVAWQGVMLDITDRIQADEAQSQLAAIVESAVDAIISSTLDGAITSWNRGAERLYGYRAEEIIGQPSSRLLPDALDYPLLQGRLAVVRSGQPLAPFETTRRRADGAIVDVLISLSPIRDRGGTVIGLSSITRDITERKRADEALRGALEAAQAGNRAKNLFLAMMSHELRTPLQAVLGYADFLLSDPSGSLTSEQAVDIGCIHQGALRMVTLIEQMLDLTRMEAGRLQLASERVDLAEMIEQVRQDIAPQVGAKGLELDIFVPQVLPPALGDPVRIRQILLNLVGNALKFTDAGALRIAAHATPDRVTVTVHDTGIGISPENLPHIFEEFRQVDSGPARRYGGAGLGLAISRRLAEEMGGEITVESAPGIGSTFALWLPSAQPTPAPASRRRRSGKAGAGQGTRHD